MTPSLNSHPPSPRVECESLDHLLPRTPRDPFYSPYDPPTVPLEEEVDRQGEDFDDRGFSLLLRLVLTECRPSVRLCGWDGESPWKEVYGFRVRPCPTLPSHIPAFRLGLSPTPTWGHSRNGEEGLVHRRTFGWCRRSEKGGPEGFWSWYPSRPTPGRIKVTGRGYGGERRSSSLPRRVRLRIWLPVSAKSTPGAARRPPTHTGERVGSGY